VTSSNETGPSPTSAGLDQQTRSEPAGSVELVGRVSGTEVTVDSGVDDDGGVALFGGDVSGEAPWGATHDARAMHTKATVRLTLPLRRPIRRSRTPSRRPAGRRSPPRSGSPRGR